jgi:hypothetical protein
MQFRSKLLQRAAPEEGSEAMLEKIYNVYRSPEPDGRIIAGDGRNFPRDDRAGKDDHDR